MTRRMVLWLTLAGCAALTVFLNAHAPSGAIFTTVYDGSEVNANQYPSKEAVYLDGGPGIGAPATAAGLDDGTYVFQITDPPGKTLLSTDIAGCRQFTVVGGLITGVVPYTSGGNPCQHATGYDVDHGAVTVQMMPYLDTPNPGGVYKAWAVRVEDYLAGCVALRKNNGLSLVDCGLKPGNFHGFVPAHSKTDNFKVKNVPVREIDTTFMDSNGNQLAGLTILWYDPLGASNRKWSYSNPFAGGNVFAHVEGIEDGFHQVLVDDQAGCTIGGIYMKYPGSATDTFVGTGPQAVLVQVKKSLVAGTIALRVYCQK